jgi:hypothetical protein
MSSLEDWANKALPDKKSGSDLIRQQWSGAMDSDTEKWILKKIF